MRAYAVIGASYGDEGKGRTVDWLSASLGPAAVVVRTNGGAQAAHTVVRGGQRHVFHHVGSGTFLGAPTHFSRSMVSHPILLGEELEQLRKLGIKARLSADPRGYVTTPWDMMVNQAIELARDGKRHGSCGLGFGETVGRNEETGYALTVADLYRPGLRETLERIVQEWLPHRIAQLGLDPGTGPLEFAGSDRVMGSFIDQCALFSRQVLLRPDALLGEAEAVIFEAAQGLLLDQNAPGFPFLTRSNTGIANIDAVAAEAGIERIEPIYVTRTYLTRHGRGPMEDERAIESWFEVDDPTNRPNPWQESLRFGLLDPALLSQRIAADLAQSPRIADPSLAISCLDQAAAKIAWLEDGHLVEGTIEQFVTRLTEASGLAMRASFRSPANDCPHQMRAREELVPA